MTPNKVSLRVPIYVILPSLCCGTGTTGGKRGFLKGGFALIGFGPTFGHMGGGSSTFIGPTGESGVPGNGISPFDWDVSTAAKPHMPSDSNARESAALNGTQTGFGGKTLQCKHFLFLKLSQLNFRPLPIL